MNNLPEQTVGKVFLIGAGPGDPALLTLRGADCLRRADLVLYDYLVNPRILEHTRHGTVLECLGRHGRGRIMPQQEVHERMIAAALQGQTVVRLKGGDPMIFAHAAEECEALRAARIPFEVVPGITAAIAAASYAGVPLTHRERASSVALVAGRENDEKELASLDYEALARFPGTLVIYMGVTTASVWSERLMHHGLSGTTPAVIVRRCSWPDQATVQTTLAEIPRVIVERKLRPPVIVIVGEVAASEPVASWFADRPLVGRRIMVTRPAGQNEPLTSRLEELGAEVVQQPAIDIFPPDDWKSLDAAVARLGEFGWLVFSSVNGVRYFIDRLLESHDVRTLGGVRMAAIGPATAHELSRYALRADVVPEEYRAEALASSLASQVRGQHVLLVRASRGREVLAEQLRLAGAIVEQVVAYESRDLEKADPAVVEVLSAGRIDWVTVTSSAIARSLAAMFGDLLHRSKLVSISPVTSETLRELGYPPALEAAEYTTDGIVRAILSA